MTNPDEDDEWETLAQMSVEVDFEDPSVNVKSLVEVARQICSSLEKPPMEGAMMLMTAGAFILDTVATRMAEKKGEEVDYERVIHSYMSTAAMAWNLNGMMFRGVTKPELTEALGALKPQGEEDEEPTLQ